LSKVGALPTECQQESAILAPLLAQYQTPSWTWFVACDEAAWTKVADHIGFTVETITTGGQPSRTDLRTKTTYVRGWAQLSPFGDDLVAQPRHIVAHELGHIMLMSRINEIRMTEASPEKAGVGGSIPSLATI
jgi:hypothetical protein